jgi:hypothetical protein
MPGGCGLVPAAPSSRQRDPAYARRDLEAIKAEAEKFETLICPEEYFEAAARGGGGMKGGNGGLAA